MSVMKLELSLTIVYQFAIAQLQKISNSSLQDYFARAPAIESLVKSQKADFQACHSLGA